MQKQQNHNSCSSHLGARQLNDYQATNIHRKLTVNTCEMSHATVSGLTYTNFHWRGLEVTGLPD